VNAHQMKAQLKGILRRQVSRFLPTAEARQYARWMKRHLAHRKEQFTEAPEPGLLSIATAVWDGSPVEHLKTLAQSIRKANGASTTDWVILDNGVTRDHLLAALADIRKIPWVKLFRSERNVGIVKGLRLCLERASGRYLLPVDADDRLYPDALSIIASKITENGYPALLYTDEDKVIGSRIFDPYLKPDWDPVLLLNSAYVAHLGILDRRIALTLGVYTDSAVEGSPDWDAFVRFMAAGHSAVHIPEIVYSWRAHVSSTADDASAKSYIHSSQRAVLQNYINSRPELRDFEVDDSPLFNGGAHFYINGKRKADKDMQPIIVRFDDRSDSLPRLLTDHPQSSVLLVGADVTLSETNDFRELDNVFALHPDAAMIGGRISNNAGRIIDAGQVLGLHGVVGCPFTGRQETDPGYFGQIWKRRSVSSVSAQLAAVKLDFLRSTLSSLPSAVSLSTLGVWLGAAALRNGKRVIYTPYLSGKSEMNWTRAASPEERQLFADRNRDLLPDRRYYPKYFSLNKPFKFEKRDKTDHKP